MLYIYVRYEHYERFTYQYGCVYFTYSYLAMLQIWLSLRRNAARTTTTVLYDWTQLNNRVIKYKYMIAQRNKFDALQEISETPTLKDEYKNFVNAHFEAAVECIPTKQWPKPRVSWETLVVRKKHADIKTVSQCNWRNPTISMLSNLRRHKMNWLTDT